MKRVSKLTLPSPRGGPAARRSSADHASVYIRQLIFDGDLRPGERVPQDEVAGALGISRIPLREALIALEREGWVTIEVNRGAFVNTMDARTVEDHYELLGEIYGLAIRKALARSGASFVDQLATINKEIAACDDPVKVGSLLMGMFAAIVEAAQSVKLNVVLRAISTPVPGAFFESVPTGIDIERRALPGIVRSLRKGDADTATADLRKMMHRVSIEVTKLFERRGLYGSSDAAVG